jgi:hypothetical protein
MKRSFASERRLGKPRLRISLPNSSALDAGLPRTAWQVECFPWSMSRASFTRNAWKPF